MSTKRDKLLALKVKSASIKEQSELLRAQLDEQDKETKDDDAVR
jgi:hypothetical protein